MTTVRAARPASPGARRPISRAGALAGAVTGLVLLATGVPALLGAGAPGSELPAAAFPYLVAAVVWPAVMLLASVTGAPSGISWPIYWMWSYVFLGLAPAYQAAAGLYPWLLITDERTLVRTLQAVLLGHAAVTFAGAVRRRRRAARQEPELDPGRRATVLTIHYLLVAQIVTALAFAAAMGPGALTGGRGAFQGRLLAVAQLPGGGSLYFLAVALSVTAPAVALAARRLGAPVGVGLLVTATAAGAIVTNPLIGSRFLTGAFLVSVLGAALVGRPVGRMLPAAFAVLLILVFPSLDLWRGDGTGASSLAVSSPAQSLVTFDFDAFEMLQRAVMTHDGRGAVLVDPLLVVVAPVVRWVPVLSDLVAGSASGPRVAEATGMTYQNVSMPMWGEGYLIAGPVGVVLVLTLLGAWLGRLRVSAGGRSLVQLLDAPTAALMFIVLRGSLYEVLGYLLFVVGLYLVLRRTQRPPSGAPQAAVRPEIPVTLGERAGRP